MLWIVGKMKKKKKKKRKHKNRYNTHLKREREERRIVVVLSGVGDDQRSHLRLSRTWLDGVSSSVS